MFDPFKELKHIKTILNNTQNDEDENKCMKNREQIHQKLTKKTINKLLFSFVSIFLNYLRRFGPKPGENKAYSTGETAGDGDGWKGQERVDPGTLDLQDIYIYIQYISLDIYIYICMYGCFQK